ncbi:MAG: hypothetical protein GTO02_16590 [Candidatus Dadabacteria bacterium]|nr:hypothetical protein [Candidatus Dadabacteria bacterium]
MLRRTRKKFTPGEPIQGNVTAEYLNSLEDRVARLERLSVGSGLALKETSFGTLLSFTGIIEEIEFVKLTEDLEPYTIANANILSLPSFLSAASSSEDDIPLSETGNDSLDVLEINGVTSIDNTIGLAVKFRRSIDKVWVFVPWPLAQGDNLPNYNFTVKQALIHAANGWLRWQDIGPCSSSGL